MIRYFPGMLLVIMLVNVSCTNNNEEELYPKDNAPCVVANVSYLTDIKPILQRECYSCHASGFNSGNVILDTYAGVKKAAEHALMPAITHEPGHTPMPLGGKKLPACDIAKIKKWTEMGAPEN